MKKPGEPGETGSNDYGYNTASRSDWVVAVVPPPAGISQFQRRTLPGNVFIWTGLARHARIAAITTTKRALPRSAAPSWLLVLQRLRDVFCMPALFWLCPRLFRGVTPYRQDGESHVRTVSRGLHIPATCQGMNAKGTFQTAIGACAIHRNKTHTAVCI